MNQKEEDDFYPVAAEELRAEADEVSVYKNRIQLIDALIDAHKSNPRQQNYLRTAKRKYDERVAEWNEHNFGFFKEFASDMEAWEAKAAAETESLWEKRRRTGKINKGAGAEESVEWVHLKQRAAHKKKLLEPLAQSRPNFETKVDGVFPSRVVIPFNEMKDLVIPKYAEFSASQAAAIASFVRTAVDRDELFRKCGITQRGAFADTLSGEWLTCAGLDSKAREHLRAKEKEEIAASEEAEEAEEEEVEEAEEEDVYEEDSSSAAAVAPAVAPAASSADS